VLLSTALLLAALYEVSDRPRQVAVGVLLVVPTLLAAWTNFFSPSKGTWVVELVAMIVFLIYILLAILRRVLSAHRVTLTELLRAVNGYIMMGIAFGLLYILVEILIPGSYHYSYGDQSIGSLLYFSFVALSTAGFGDITAISPIARSVVMIEMVLGVMYMAVFIGLLVNAHYSTRYSPREDNDTRQPPMYQVKEAIRLPLLSSGGPLTLIAIAVILDLATSVIMVSFHFPVYMDTWGTSFAVMTGGFLIGACAGVLYNIVMATTVWNLSSVIWAVSSILVAAATWIFWKRGFLDVRKPLALIAAGTVTGVLNSVLIMMVTALFTLPPYEGTQVVFAFFASFIGNPGIASVAGIVVVEVIDKTLSLALAAVAVLFFHDLLQKNADTRETTD
jgi:hypothetical protein